MSFERPEAGFASPAQAFVCRGRRICTGSVKQSMRALWQDYEFAVNAAEIVLDFESHKCILSYSPITSERMLLLESEFRMVHCRRYSR
jgi:hypothetical protein